MQNVINAQVLIHLFALSASSSSHMQVNAIVNYKLEELASWLRSSKSTGVQKMYEKEFLKSISDFMKDPSKFKKVSSPAIPDGSPIGMH